MTCPACSHQNRPGGKFCEECAAPLKRLCSHCGAELRPTARFCDECATPVAGNPAQPVSARKVLTIVFADLVGSTALHERLDSEAARVFMERYHAAMRGAVDAQDGTVAKLMGDGVMAVFGAPRVAEDDAIRAVRVAAAMQDAFRTLGEQQSALVGAIGLRVAVNTGEIVADERSELIGDPVNVAARLQQEAGDGNVVIGEATRRLIATLVTLAIWHMVCQDQGGTPMKQYERFDGVIGRTHADSKPWWPTPPHPGDAAPNVVVILLDDLGFAQLGCFGSDIETPHVDRLAAGGLRFTNFHVTPVCSPTRAALLTGRNHHTVGMRSVSNFSSGYPHMRGQVSNHAATMAEVLRAAGYATFGLGKWHLCQMENASAAGPYDQWPCQRGFDRYYGFLDGETDQFTPELIYDNHAVAPPATPEQGYHLSEDLLDHAIRFIHDSKSIRPDRPFFTYLAFGATHAPHQAPAAYLDKYRGRFDAGWDDARARWFARQLDMGIVPPGTSLAPRNPGVEPWDTLSTNQRRLACRLQEAFAAFLDHTDAQIGRLVAALGRLGQLDDTVIFLLSDNGASQEGGPFGVLHEMKFFNFILESPDDAVARLDDIGGPSSHANYPWGWAQAGNTPFKWYKQNTHEGGVHVPLIVHWPATVTDGGGLRGQFHYVTDIAPTVYEIVGVTPPEVYRGLEQMPITGTSMRYCFDAATAHAPARKRVQYFEMMGHRAIYADGWKAVTRHQPGVSFDDDTWELYHVAEDRSECHDLAAAMPEKLAEMIALWWAEAEEHGVLPLDDRTLELFGARFRARSPHPERRRYTYYPPMTSIPAQVGAQIGGRSWDLAATIERPAGAGGVLYATGNQNSGVTLFVQHDRLVFDYNCFGEHHVVASTALVPTGPSVVGVRFRRLAQGGEATLVIDGKTCGAVRVPFVMRMISSVGASVGYDHGSPVSLRYAGEFPFEGDLRRLDIDLVKPGTADAAELAATDERSTMARQ